MRATARNRMETMGDVRVWLAGILIAGLAACGPADAEMREADVAEVQDAAAEAMPSTAGDRVSIRVGGVEIEVEIADEPAEHSRGLMFRESLPENHGMLFVYPEERTLGFWMKNTLIPLDVAYADREGRIVDIQ